MTFEEMEKKIREFEDIEEIKKLHVRYVYWLNDRKWDEIINSFIDDAWVHIEKRPMTRGKEELTKLFKEKIAQNNAKTNGCHFVMQPIINVNGDEATGTWFMCIVFAVDSPAGPTLAWRQGRHDCEYVKVDGKWKYKSIKFTNTAPEQVKWGTIFG